MGGPGHNGDERDDRADDHAHGPVVVAYSITRIVGCMIYVHAGMVVAMQWNPSQRPMSTEKHKKNVKDFFSKVF